MNTVLAIVTCIGGILAFLLFKNSNALKALQSLFGVKEKDITIERDIIKNDAMIAIENQKIAEINKAADAAKTKETTGEDLANELNDLFNKPK